MLKTVDHLIHETASVLLIFQGIRVRRRRGELQLILRPKTGAGYHFVCSGYDDRNDKLHEKNIHVNIIGNFVMHNNSYSLGIACIFIQ